MPQTITILDAQGAESGSLEISEKLLGVEAKPLVVRQALNQHLANRRQGTHAAKNRALVRGSGAKPWRQKGTGRARAGTRKSGIWRGGGAIFGPSPRSYRQRLNKKMKRAALLGVLSDYQREGRLYALESIEIDEPKTREMLAFLGGLGVEGRVLIMIDPGEKDAAGEYGAAARNLFLSSRNLQWVTALSYQNINIFDLLTHDCLVIDKDALRKLEERYQ